MSEKKGLKALMDIKFLGVPLPYFAIFSVVLWIGLATGILPPTSFALFTLLLTIALPLRFIGDKTPILGKYVGFGPLLAIFFPAVLPMIGFITEDVSASISSLLNDVITPLNLGLLMCGAMLGKLDRNTLIKAIVRYLPVLVLSLAATTAFALLIGPLLGYDRFTAVVNIAYATYSGGTGACMVSIPTMMKEAGLDGDAMVGPMLAAVSVANVIAICISAILDSVGKKFPKMTGNGNLIRSGKDLEFEENVTPFDGKISSIVTGFLVAGLLYGVGMMIATIMKPIININYIVWLMLLCLVLKMVKFFPKHIEDCVNWASQMGLSILLPAVMAGIGITQIDLASIVSVLTPQFFFMILLVVVAYVGFAMLFGHLFGMYAIESGIAVGCCSCDLGGTGDILNCTVSNRMDLYPFASISTRIGGAFAVICVGFLIPLLM